MAVGAAVAHSVWNLLPRVGLLSNELSQKHSAEVASLPSFLWMVAFAVLFFGGVIVIARTKRDDDPNVEKSVETRER